MEEDKNKKFDDLFRNFFKEKVNNLPKQNIGKTPPVLQKESTKNISSIINDLVGESNPPPKKTRNTPQRKEFIRRPLEESKVVQPTVTPPVQKTIKSTSKEEKILETKELSEAAKTHIEGGSSEELMNPAVILNPHSTEVDEILSYVPNWMIRWGITVIFLILISILAMSYFIKYPDIVKGQITIVSDTPPASVLPKSSGALQLFKKDREIIEEGETIALIKNDARYDDIQQLKVSLEDLKSKLDNGKKLKYFKFPKDMDLGSLQGTFSELVFSLKNQQVQKKSRSNDFRRKAAIDKQINQVERIEREQNQQIATLQAEYNRAKEAFDKRYRALYTNGSISKAQLDDKESEVTQKLNAYQNAKTGIGENKKRILDLESQKDELDYNDSQTTSSNFNAISIAYSKLINDINSWENQFLLMAPISGRLNYLQFVKDNIHVKIEQEIASIVPLTNDEEVASTLGELFVSSVGLGKIDLGQTVNIELDAYMKKEYGLIEGKVLEIADVGTSMPSAEGVQTLFKIEVGLDKGLKTTMGEQIDFRHNMKGKAEIITKDVRLIERIFNELRDAMDF